MFYAQPTKTLEQGKVHGCKIQKACLTLPHVVKHDKHRQMKTYMYLQISMPKMLRKMVAKKIDPLNMLVGVNHLVSTLQLSNIIIVF